MAAFLVGGCTGSAMQDASVDADAGSQGPVDFFQLAVNGAPGGSLLSAWVQQTPDERVTVATTAFLAGGFVGVDPAQISDGAVGRLIEYTRPGQFTTRCTSDRVLWWVHGARDASGQFVIWAAGEGGRILRYSQGRCEPMATDFVFAHGAPSFWGTYAVSPTDVYFVGGYIGPIRRGVVLHYDGTSFQELTDVPGIDTNNLYKISSGVDSSGSFLVAVGGGGLVVRRALPDGPWQLVPSGAPSTDNTLFTVSCDGPDCFAVGGNVGGLVVHGNGSTDWSVASSVGGVDTLNFPGLNGVWLESQNSVYLSGPNGFLLHATPAGAFQPRLTVATIHAIAGIRGSTDQNAPLVIGVGGELGVSNATQRALVVVRGDPSPTFMLDGHVYMGAGGLTSTPPGWGQ